MEHGCSLTIIAANDEPALVGTTWTLLCPLIYHLYIFSPFRFFFYDMSKTPTVHFFISWDVSVELLYAHISQISNTKALCSCSFVYGVKMLSIYVFQVYRLIIYIFMILKLNM